MAICTESDDGCYCKCILSNLGERKRQTEGKAVKISIFTSICEVTTFRAAAKGYNRQIVTQFSWVMYNSGQSCIMKVKNISWPPHPMSPNGTDVIILQTVCETKREKECSLLMFCLFSALELVLPFMFSLCSLYNHLCRVHIGLGVVKKRTKFLRGTNEEWSRLH